MWFLLYYLLHLLRSHLCSHKFRAIQILYLNTILKYGFLKNHLQRGVFCNVNLSNLENVLQKNLRPDRVGECIFRAFGGRNFEFFFCSVSTMVAHFGYDVVPVCPKKLWIRHGLWIRNGSNYLILFFDIEFLRGSYTVTEFWGISRFETLFWKTNIYIYTGY